MSKFGGIPVEEPKSKFGGVAVSGSREEAYKQLDQGLMYETDNETTNQVESVLSPQDMQFEQAKIFYDTSTGTNNPPEMIDARIKYEYGDDATPQTANQMNKKAVGYLNEQQKQMQDYAERTATFFKTPEIGRAVYESMKLKKEIPEPIGIEGPQAAKDYRAQKLDEYDEYKQSLPIEAQIEIERLESKLEYDRLKNAWAGRDNTQMPESVKQRMKEIDEELGLTDTVFEQRVLGGRAKRAIDVFNFSRYSTHKEQQIAVDVNAGSKETAQNKIDRLHEMQDASAETLPKGEKLGGKIWYGALGSVGPMGESIVSGALTGGTADKAYWAAQGQGSIISDYARESGVKLNEMSDEDYLRLQSVSQVAGGLYAATEYLGGMYGLQRVGIFKKATQKLVGQAVKNPALAKKIVTGGAKFVWEWMKENAEEGMQGFVTEVGRQVIEEDVDLGEAAGEAKKQFIEAAPATLGITALGGGVSMAQRKLTQRKHEMPFTLGDANVVRKENDNAQIDEMVDNDPLLADDPIATEKRREMYKNPTEETVAAVNQHPIDKLQQELDAQEAAQDAQQQEAGQEQVDVVGEDGKPYRDPAIPEGTEDVAEITDQEIDSLPLQELSDKAEKILSAGEKVKGVFKPVLSLTTRIKEIAPRAKMALDKADQKTHKIISSNTVAIESFSKTTKAVKKQITKEEWNTVKAEILNGNWNALEKRGIEGIPQLQMMFQETAEALGIQSIDNYFRRKVKDYDGLIRHLGEDPKGRFKKAIEAREKELGKKLNTKEKSTTIRNELRTKEGSGLGAKRTIETLTPEMAKFYEDPLFELENYIRQSAQTISRKEMLGIDQGVTDELGEADPSVADGDISSIIAEMSEEGMTRKQEQELAELLQSALEYKRAPKFVEMLRRAVSLKYVTKVKTTVKQFGDFFVNVGENGLVNVLGSTQEAKKWSDEFGKEVELSLQEQGVEKLDAELQADKRKMLEEAVFKPLQGADLLNKRVLMRSTAMKWRRMAESNPTKLKTQLMQKFNHDVFVDGIISDMQGGVLSEDVSFALYSQMADFHPISHSQHIKLYIDQPMLRPLFMLKSFAFKRFDRLYREGISQVVDGLAKNRAGAVDNNVELRKEGADQLASGTLGLARFFIFAIGGEMLVEKLYKEAMQALGWAPEEIPEDESWSAMYLQEMSRVAPFVDPYSAEKAIERGDPWLYFEEAHDIPAPLGSDAIKDLIKHMRGTKDADVNKWKKDIPWLGELAWGAEQESRETQLMDKRKKQVKDN